MDAYREGPCHYFFTDPTPLFCIGEEFHVSVCKMRAMVRIEDENTWFCLFGSIRIHGSKHQLARLEQGIMLQRNFSVPNGMWNRNAMFLT